ncbi:MAG: response regulator transcription factor [Gammaproteobacteria bacterium]|nr:response regulator transcription factor [Gammaproteobacteria bacterium]
MTDFPRAGETTGTGTLYRVLLILRNELTRLGLLLLMRDDPTLHVVGSVATLIEAGYSIANRGSPHVVVTDMLPAGTPEESAYVIEEISSAFAESRILVLADRPDEAYAEAAVAAGARGLLSWHSSYAEVSCAIHRLARGGMYFGPDVLPAPAFPVGAAPRVGAADVLSPQQHKVLRLVAAGLSNRLIADALAVSLSTVQKYRAELLHRFGVHNVAALVHAAMRAGLLDPDTEY